MDAITYLMNRNWAPARKSSLILLVGTLLSWVNWRIAQDVPGMFPRPFMNGELVFVWSIFEALVGLAAFATLSGVIVLAPSYVVFRLSSTLHSWIRQRAVEEMVCAGLTGREVLDRTALFAGRWWLQVAVPAAVLGIVLFPGPTGLSAEGVGFYLLSCATVLYLGLYAAAWTGFASGKIKLPLLLSIAVVQGVPALALMFFGVSTASLVAAAIYVIVTARSAAIYALENAQVLSGMDNRFRRAMRMKVRVQHSVLAENPILARETLRGADSSDLISRLLMAVSLALTLMASLMSKEPWLLVGLFLAMVLLSSYRAAGKMSQIVTEEVENGTLETIRSTPMASQSFLNGWMMVVVRQQWVDLSVLAIGVALGLWFSGASESLQNPSVSLVVGLAVVLPFLGSLLGASIAGQAKPRSQITGQLMLVAGATGLFGLPQLTIAWISDQLALHLVGLLVVTLVVGWLFNEGAKKSLNRVFLPQK